MQVPRRDYIRAAEVRAAVLRFEREAEAIPRRFGLTPQRHLLLLMIKGAPDGSERATVTELAERLGLAQHTVTEAVRRAEDAGLLTREPCAEDRRRTWLRLTREGERRLAASVAALDPVRDRLVSELASRRRR